MKKLLSVILIVVLIASFACGCNEEEKGRILYEGTDFSKYVELGNYKGIVVDTESEEFAEFYDEVILMDVVDNGFYTEKDLTEGKIEDGDIANIDFTGKMDGKEFEGGSGEKYDLEIGSGTFFEGFEEGLIGVEIGTTVDLNLTFPKDYGHAEFAGKPVVFTVKINSANRKTMQKPEEYFSKLNFKSVGDYTKDVRDRAIENYLLDEIIMNSKIKGYPEKELKILFDTSKKMLEKYYEVDFADFLETAGQTEEDYKNEQIKPMMDVQLVLYAILDKEGIKFTKDEVEAEINRSLKDMGDTQVTREQMIEYFGEFYFEETVVCNKVMEFIHKKAKLK